MSYAGAFLQLLRKNMRTVSLPMDVSEYTNPAAASVNSIKTSIATSASDQTYSGSALNGTIGAGTIDPPRNMTVTSSSHADVNAVAVVFTGTDLNGATITDTITLTDNGNTTDVGVKAFRTVTSIFVPANGGTGGALQFGTGVKLGLLSKPAERAAKPMIIRELQDGVAPGAAGTFVSPTTSPPNGTYVSNAAPDGARDFVLYYERAG